MIDTLKAASLIVLGMVLLAGIAVAVYFGVAAAQADGENNGTQVTECQCVNCNATSTTQVIEKHHFYHKVGKTLQTINNYITNENNVKVEVDNENTNENENKAQADSESEAKAENETQVETEVEATLTGGEDKDNNNHNKY